MSSTKSCESLSAIITVRRIVIGNPQLFRYAFICRLQLKIFLQRIDFVGFIFNVIFRAKTHSPTEEESLQNPTPRLALLQCRELCESRWVLIERRESVLLQSNDLDPSLPESYTTPHYTLANPLRSSVA
jgi:hypothetical protein